MTTTVLRSSLYDLVGFTRFQQLYLDPAFAVSLVPFDPHFLARHPRLTTSDLTGIS